MLLPLQEYYHVTMSVEVLKISQLLECLVCEASTQNKRGLFVSNFYQRIWKITFQYHLKKELILL